MSKTDLYLSVYGKGQQLHEHNDCVVIAISIALVRPYEDVHRRLRRAGRKNRDGVYRKVAQKIVEAYRFRIIQTAPRRPTGSKYSCLTILDACRPNASYLCWTADHCLAIVDGEIHDWSSDRRMPVYYLWEIVPARNARRQLGKGEILLPRIPPKKRRKS